MTTLRPRTTSIVIYQGDDMNTLAELRRAADVAVRLAELSDSSALRIGDDTPDDAQSAKDAYDAFLDVAAERAVTVELHAIGRRRFRDLLAAHPPRRVKVKRPTEDDPAAEVEETHEDDAGFDVNTVTFPEALLTFIDPDDSDVRTIAAPAFKDRKAVAAFLDDEIADGDFDSLWTAAYYLNRMPSQDPKASRFSTGHRSSTET